MSFGKDLKTKVEKYRLVRSKYPLRGCSDVETEEVMKAQGVKRLPEVYREFLMELGNEAGIPFQRNFYTCDSLKFLKDSVAERLTEEKVSIELPLDSFVCMSFSGDVFHFFRTDAINDQDPVVLVLEFGDEIGEASIRSTGMTVSEMLTSDVLGYAKALDRL